MNTLILTRGLPGSGKTTFARSWVDQDCHQRVRVNRDDLRQMVYGRPAPLPYQHEQALTVAQHAQVRALLQAGHSVIVDDTNLRAKYARAYADLAAEVGADFSVVDIDTPVDECVLRDHRRGVNGGRTVGEAVIRDMAARFQSRPPILPTQPVDLPALVPYTPDEALPEAWIVDIDGTIALMGDRGPYEWHRVGEDSPNHPVIEVVRALHGDLYRIVLLSARDGSCREQTEAWLADQDVPYHELHMRKAGDCRKDSIVKAELFDTHLRGRFNVRGVLDDRTQVVRLWRSLGLTCLQVAEGEF